MYTPKFLTTAVLVIISSPTLMESSPTLSSYCWTPTVAVHEYANGTSAHDTVLEHRFSPM